MVRWSGGQVVRWSGGQEGGKEGGSVCVRCARLCLRVLSCVAHLFFADGAH